jgi:deoxyhypusine synthase
MGGVRPPRQIRGRPPRAPAAAPRRFLAGPRILPKPIRGTERLPDLIDRVFLAYNAGRLQEGCRLFTEKMLGPDVTVGMSLAGALTPAGLGASAVIPLIKAGFVDWIVATGANLYHDLHHALNLPLHRGSPFVRDAELRRAGVVRIYDVLLDARGVLEATDRALQRVLRQPEFQREMGTAELHHRLGRYCAGFERQAGARDASVLAAAYRAGVPCFCPSPGDSSIGMNMAELALRGGRLRVNPNVDVNQSTAIVLEAQRSGRRSGVLLVGGGSPKNFVLQTEPQIQEVLRIPAAGHEYFLQFTDARPDTGGLSGATPSEAVSWGKVDPRRLPDAVVCYVDSSVALPLLTPYALARHAPRRPKRLVERLPELVRRLERAAGARRP